MFDALGERLQVIFRTLRGHGHLTENEIREGLREIRMALLEADVDLSVVKDFTEAVRLDPGNATAKYDLEGLLYLYKPLSNGEPPPLKRQTATTGPDSGGGGSPGSSVGAGGF